MKNVVIAGGTTGMGREIALHYLRRGARVTAIGSTLRGVSSSSRMPPYWPETRPLSRRTCCQWWRTTG